MKSPKKSSTPAPASKIDPAFVPKARVLIKKIKAKLNQLNASSPKKAAGTKKSASPAKAVKRAKSSK